MTIGLPLVISIVKSFLLKACTGAIYNTLLSSLGKLSLPIVVSYRLPKPSSVIVYVDPPLVTEKLNEFGCTSEPKVFCDKLTILELWYNLLSCVV